MSTILSTLYQYLIKKYQVNIALNVFPARSFFQMHTLIITDNIFAFSLTKEFHVYFQFQRFQNAFASLNYILNIIAHEAFFLGQLTITDIRKNMLNTKNRHITSIANSKI